MKIKTDLVECPVGLEEKPLAEFVIFQCNHKICYDPCFKKMIRLCSNNRNLLKCPMCCRPILISKNTSSKIYQKSKRLLESQLRRDLQPSTFEMLCIAK